MPPIFIVSWVRSGSTLLRFIVDSHPQIACPAEVEVGPLAQALVQTLVATIGVRAPGELGRRLVIDEIRRIVSSIMADYAHEKHKPLWCDKSPTNALYLPLIESVFPEARFICLYRDGVDVVHSSTEFRLKERIDVLDTFVAKAGNQLEGAIDGWVEATGHMLALEQRRPDQCYRLHYEKLVSDAPACVADMLAWLGVHPDPTILERVFKTPHDPGEGDSKILFSSSVNGRSIGRGRAIGVANIDTERKTRFDARLTELAYAAADVKVVRRGFTITQFDLAHFMRATLPERLRERAGELRSIGAFKLVIEHFTPAAWIFDFSGPRPYLAPVDRPTASTITLSAATLTAILTGDENPATAYLDGRIRIDGDATLLRVLRFLV